MAHYKITIAYDGTSFKGFQRQVNGYTVQAEIERALGALGWQGKSIIAAGRTDTGVHATGQVVTFHLEWKHSMETLQRALNAHLMSEVVVRKVELSDAEFHPRFDAAWRSYQYRIYYDDVKNPLLERYAWRVSPSLNYILLLEAASLLSGTHNFAAFGSPHKPGGNTERTVYLAEWEQIDNGLLFTINANAFLYHMVRRLVFLQVLIGKEKLNLKLFQSGVEHAVAQPPGLAPPQGLTLVEVHYHHEE